MGRDFSFQWQPPSQRGEMFLLKKLRYKQGFQLKPTYFQLIFRVHLK